jgi:ribose transport system substrate-binding protein
MAGEEVKKALPNGGKIMVFVGKADAQNAKERYEGLKAALEGSKVEIIDLRTDDTDHARAKQNAADTLTSYPDVAGMVGLWSYNGPAIINAVKEAGKSGKVKIVCFDEEADTLAGIADGTVTSTIVQQPYEFGYQSMILLSKVLGGDKSVIPADKKVIIPTRVIDKAGVEEFSAKLKELRGK